MGNGVTDVSIAGGLIFQDGWQILIGTTACVIWSLGIGHVKSGYYSVWYLRGDEPSTTYNLSDSRIKKDIETINNSLHLIKIATKKNISV